MTIIMRLALIVTVLSLTGGSALLMWIGEQITSHGVGNGISMVLLIQHSFKIASGFWLTLRKVY